LDELQRVKLNVQSWMFARRGAGQRSPEASVHVMGRGREPAEDSQSDVLQRETECDAQLRVLEHKRAVQELFWQQQLYTDISDTCSCHRQQ
jgi:hypothetical protein